MDIIYCELNNERFQEITLTRDCNLVSIRPHVYRKRNPTGSLKVQILDANGLLIDESNTIAISTIGVGGVQNQDFAHGYLKFDIETPLQNGLNYRINLVALGGYVFNENNHIGILRDFDLRKVTAAYSPNTGINSALDIELWERKMGSRLLEFFDGFESAAEPAADVSLPEQEAEILNAEGGPTDVTNFIFNKDNIEASKVQYRLFRRTDSAERSHTGIISVQFKPEAATWSIERESEFDNDLGVTFTITAAGQIQYSSDNLAGAAYKGFITFETIRDLGPEV